MFQLRRHDVGLAGSLRVSVEAEVPPPGFRVFLRNDGDREFVVNALSPVQARALAALLTTGANFIEKGRP